MSDIFDAIGKAARSVLHPRMLALVIWPALVAFGLWLGLAWIYWDTWLQWMQATITGSQALQWLSQGSLDMLARYSALVLMLVILAPLIFITAVTIAAVVQMPLIVRFVADRDYPQLEKRRGGTLAGSIANALTAVLLFALLWVATLPLWLTGVLAPVLAVLLSGYLNQRLFRYDALSEHAGPEEYRAIVAAHRGRMFVLGTLLGALYFVPLLNLLVPVLSGLAFTHYALAQLARARAQKAD